MKNMHMLGNMWECPNCIPVRSMTLGMKKCRQCGYVYLSDEIKAAIAGNICICSNYDHIINAIMVASEKLRRR